VQIKVQIIVNAAIGGLFKLLGLVLVSLGVTPLA